MFNVQLPLQDYLGNPEALRLLTRLLGRLDPTPVTTKAAPAQVAPAQVAPAQVAPRIPPPVTINRDDLHEDEDEDEDDNFGNRAEDEGEDEGDEDAGDEGDFNDIEDIEDEGDEGDEDAENAEDAEDGNGSVVNTPRHFLDNPRASQALLPRSPAPALAPPRPPVAATPLPLPPARPPVLPQRRAQRDAPLPRVEYKTDPKAPIPAPAPVGKAPPGVTTTPSPTPEGPLSERPRATSPAPPSAAPGSGHAPEGLTPGKPMLTPHAESFLRVLMHRGKVTLPEMGAELSMTGDRLRTVVGSITRAYQRANMPSPFEAGLNDAGIRVWTWVSPPLKGT